MNTLALSDLHLHDVVLHRVIENTVDDTLSFEVDYPVDWDRNAFERRVIIFTDVLGYEVHEIPFAGSPTLLDWSLQGRESGRDVVRIETNAGYRQFAFKQVSLAHAT
jgi:hypothetical protein